MHNWDPIAVIGYITGSPVVKTVIVILLSLFGEIPKNQKNLDIYDEKYLALEFMFYSRLLCIFFYIIVWN
jgi:hypothetical protein